MGVPYVRPPHVGPPPGVFPHYGGGHNTFPRDPIGDPPRCGPNMWKTPPQPRGISQGGKNPGPFGKGKGSKAPPQNIKREILTKGKPPQRGESYLKKKPSKGGSKHTRGERKKKGSAPQGENPLPRNLP